MAPRQYRLGLIAGMLDTTVCVGMDDRDGRTYFIRRKASSRRVQVFPDDGCFGGGWEPLAGGTRTLLAFFEDVRPALPSEIERLVIKESHPHDWDKYLNTPGETKQ